MTLPLRCWLWMLTVAAVAAGWTRDSAAGSEQCETGTREPHRGIGGDKVSRAAKTNQDVVFLQVGGRLEHRPLGALEELSLVFGASDPDTSQASATSPVAPAAVTTEPATDGSCGFAEPTKLACGTSARHTCENSTALAALRRCPAACPFIAADSFLPCTAACVAAENCLTAGPGYTFADPETHLCSTGPIDGCRKYAARVPTALQLLARAFADGVTGLGASDTDVGELAELGVVPNVAVDVTAEESDLVKALSDLGGRTKEPGPVCEECLHLFDLSADGTSCEYYMHSAQSFFTILLILVSTVVAGAVPVILYRACVLPQGNPAVLKKGWEHWQRCLVSARAYADPTKRYKPYPLSLNVHRELVAGPGLCLYYNTLLYMGIVFIILTGVTAWLQFQGGADLQNLFGEADSIDAQTCRLPQPGAETQAMARELASFQHASAYTMACLWLTLFVLSLWHAGRQHVAFRLLDRKFSSMSDFGLKAAGFPSDAGEAEIETFFSNFAPLAGVSVCYDYSQHLKLVSKMLEHHLHEQDVASGFVNPVELGMGVAEVELRDLVGDGGAARKDLDMNEAKRALAAFPGSGTAFAVFHTEELRCEFTTQWMAGKPPMFRGRHHIHIKSFSAEPTTFHWENFVLSWNARIWNGVRELLILLVECVVILACVYTPVSHYVLGRATSTGDAAGDHVVQVLGLLVACVNGALYVLVDSGSNRVGFLWKEQVDTCNLTGCVLIVAVNTAFNLWISVMAAEAAHPMLVSHQGGDVDDLGGVRKALVRTLIAKTLWDLFFPGILLVPYLGYPFYKCMLSLKANVFYWVSIPLWPVYSARDLRSDRNVRLWDAERLLEPEPIQVEFDYANNICVAGTAMTLLFFEGSYMFRVCFVLLFWLVFTYASNKYCHLRWMKLVEYTTPLLTDTYQHLWGLVVSIPAAAAVYWNMQANNVVDAKGGPAVTFGWPCAAFLGALLTYWILLGVVLWFTKSDSDEGSGEYMAARKRLRYDYFNTNPIRVLRSQYLPDQGEPIVFFRRGKEYLQRASKRKDAPLFHNGGSAPSKGRAHALLDAPSSSSSLSEESVVHGS